MEDALTEHDAVKAALRFRVVRIPNGVGIEPGGPDDHLFDCFDALSIIRIALERGDKVVIEVPLGQ